ncbi:hypothetical protein K461DRAFT_216858, partial [Myriangium duriaei CBS 260.36]
MAVRGGGPSRRSHTKSRKGCKTCKRRHIRCDESFPQCRNCTKHHVRCDYMDATTPDNDSLTTTSSERASPTPTPTSDECFSVNSFRADSSYTDLGLLLPSEAENQFGPDSHLIHNLFAIADNLDTKGASDLTVWVSTMRRHLTIAPAYPYMLDALKAFSASQIAWLSHSQAARDQSIQYSTSALSGLHHAVGQFNKANADSVLATACLLVSQSKDWLSWSSLLGGITSITAAIESWQQESIYSDEVKRINAYSAWKATGQDLENIDTDRLELLKRISLALHRLRSQLGSRPVETNWVDQFIDLIQRLQTAEPAKSAEEQFNHLYVLRKWIFWLPVYLLQDGPIDMLKLSVIAHLYATALALGPIFPRLGTELCGDNAAPALLHVLSRMRAMQSEMAFFDTSSLIEFPSAVLAEFNARSPWSSARPQPALQIPDISMYFTEEPNMPGNLSPAFTPAAFEPAHTRASSTASAFLEVPTPQRYTGMTGFTNNISQWGSFPSPIFPTQDF